MQDMRCFGEILYDEFMNCCWAIDMSFRKWKKKYFRDNFTEVMINTKESTIGMGLGSLLMVSKH